MKSIFAAIGIIGCFMFIAGVSGFMIQLGKEYASPLYKFSHYIVDDIILILKKYPLTKLLIVYGLAIILIVATILNFL